MRCLSILALAGSVLAQDPNYLPGLLAGLQGAGLTSLATAATALAQDNATLPLLAELQNGNKTVFAPNNAAFSAAPANLTSNTTALGSILSYHIVQGTFGNASAFATHPNHTIVRTYLNDSAYVQLEGNKSQVLGITNDDGGIVRILNQEPIVRVVSTTAYQNLIIHVIDGVLVPPPSVSAALGTVNLTTLPTLLEQAQALDIVENSKGITIFAPNDAAFAAALPSLGTPNASVLATILGNHIINGASVYSTLLSEGSYTSGSGQPFSFNVTSNGTFVTSGNSTARITSSDVLTNNGVIHIIDAVLANTASDAGAASSAASSAADAATSSATETGGVGVNPTQPPQQGGGNGGGGNTGAAVRTELSLAASVVAISMAIGAFLF